MTSYYCVSSLPLPDGIRVTTITYYCVSSLLLPYGIRVTTEQPALALRHTRYYYYMTTYYRVSSLPLPYFIRDTTIT